MEATVHGPLRSLVEYELIEPGERKLQVFYKKRRILSEDDMASISPTGEIVFRGKAYSSIGGFCTAAVGKPVHTRICKRVFYGESSIEKLREQQSSMAQPLPKDVPHPPPAPSVEPAEYQTFVTAFAELIQTRFQPLIGGN